MSDEFREVNDQIYNQLKARYLANPDSLSKGEKEAMVMAAFVRVIDLNDKVERNRTEVLEWLWNGITRCRLLVEKYESGDYPVSNFEDDYDAVWDDRVKAEQAAHKYDLNALEKMYELDNRYMQIVGLI